MKLDLFHLERTEKIRNYYEDITIDNFEETHSININIYSNRRLTSVNVIFEL